jgi:hypothetical protein
MPVIEQPCMAEAPPPQHWAKRGSGAMRPEVKSARVRTFVFIGIMIQFDFDYDHNTPEWGKSL